MDASLHHMYVGHLIALHVFEIHFMLPLYALEVQRIVYSTYHIQHHHPPTQRFYCSFLVTVDLEGI